jgi:outer membrane receptor protein involved in Fe transport
MSSSSTACSRLIVLVVAIVILAGTAMGQKDTGSIVGTVTDSAGAVVANAKVTVSDSERGINFTTSTNDEGQYVAGPLKIGRYIVTVEQAGFKKAISRPVDLDVQQRVSVDIQLQVGEVTESIQVSGAAPLLETETSELGHVVDSRSVANLPLNGRNFAQLALLSAGTAGSEPGARDEKSFGFSANGARSLQNNFLLDGVDNNSNLPDLLNETNFVIQPPVEALQEFKVQTNAYSAEFGRGNGAVINAVIKSGTNTMHGAAWEFLRNDKLDSRNFFDDRTKPTPPYKQSQFGATFGGPVYIPHVYNGRNRTFFFVDYEGLHIRQSQTQTAFVPSLAERKGDFSELINYSQPLPVLDCNGRPTYSGEIFDTRLTQNQTSSPTGQCGIPFGYNSSGQPVNIIPASPSFPGGGSLDPLALRLAALYPKPGPLANGVNFLSNPVLKQTRNNFDTRVDQKFTDRDDTFFRFSYEYQPSSIPGSFGGVADGGGFFSGEEENSYRSFATSWTHILKPQLINEFRLGYNRINATRFQLNANTDISGQLGFPGVPFAPGLGGLPQLTFSDVSTIGSPTFLPSRELQNSYTLSDNLNWVKGKHALKYGTEIRREEFTIFQPASPRGNLNFTAALTDNPAALNTGGSGFASFMAGLTTGGAINNLHNVDYFRWTYAFYAQDDWKLTPRLTFNVGLRYELFLPVTERHDQMGTFDLSNPTNPTVIVPEGQNAQLTPFISTLVRISRTGSRGLVDPDLNNFAPRIGLAYKLQAHTVLRAGYGIFYGGQENGPYSNPSMGFNPPFFVTQSFNQPCTTPSGNPASGQTDCTVPGLRNLFNGFPANSLSDPSTPTLFSVDPHLRTPYMQQWHLSVQHEFPGNNLIDLTYAGSKGNKLFVFYNGNQATPTADPTSPIASRRPVPLIDSGISSFRSGGASSYNSLQAHYEKRFSHGLQLQASYTWAHSIDNASNANLGPTQNNSDFRDFRHPEREFGNSDFDVRHRFVVSSIYELPVGHGKHFLGDATGILSKIVEGWQFANIVTVSSGNSYTVLDNGSFSNSDGGAGGVSQRPDRVGDPNATPCVPGTFFNTCAFANPSAGSFGNVGRNTIRGPGYRVWDLSIFKIIQTSERTKLEFRAEFFNILNHTNFLFARPGPQSGNNSTILGTQQFGFVTAAHDPRQIQFALKFSF